MADRKWVYTFHEVEQAEEHVGGDWDEVRALLGGKGANLAEMTRIGIPVPPGFTVTTETCLAYLDAGEEFPEGMWEQELDALKAVEEETGKKFGDPDNPLLLSARSGAVKSMPGMMDTVLNIGLNAETVQGMIDLTGDPRFVYDSYRRLIQMFGSVVLGIDDEAFEDVLDEYKEENDYELDTELTAEDWKVLSEEFKKIVKKEKGFEFPEDPYEQLKMATEAVFSSWNVKRAVDYRNAAGIPHDLGTAVNVMTMVFGNMGENSGTGVAFTRNPSTGEKKLWGEYLMNAQGEDVVAGIRNAEDIQDMKDELPEVFQEFKEIAEKLEKHYKEVQDVEFTIENGKLWMLQTRDGKRTAKAAVKIAVDFSNEDLITREEAVTRIETDQVDTLLHPQFIPEEKDKAQREGKKFATGVNASPGAAVGRVYFDADTAEHKAKEEGQDVIMVRPFTKPDDVHGMLAAKGILTSEGGATSHAAVVARQFGIPCVVGASEISIDRDKLQLSAGDVMIREGDYISVDGTTGEVFVGEIESIAPKLEEQDELMELLSWADEISATEGIRQAPDGWPTKGLEVWANADYPEDARRARSYGAQGIGLCRTEHMFFEPDRLPIVQDMILAESEEKRVEALDKLLPHQRSDFDGLFEAMTGLPVIIRLIDPPLHEFMPDEHELLVEVIESRVRGEENEEKAQLLADVQEMHESNPMMGLRGVRLSVVMPEIVSMQVRAIFEAAADVKLRGFEPKPEVMIPLTGHINELHFIQPKLEEIAEQVMEEKGVEFEYKFGTMIEIPRAGLTADEIAETAEFFSFGTNDLTQFTFGYSRDDAERNFLVTYVEEGILPENPFQTIDRAGVGELMDLTVKKGRGARTDLEVGICGEHGGDPQSIDWCHQIGLNYVSCSPFRVPIARLAAAKAALEHRK
jgi:pyruvate,orthophosphate dikinase